MSTSQKKILYIITVPDWGGAQWHIYNDVLFELEKPDKNIIIAFGQSDGGKNLFNIIHAKHRHQFKHLIRKINPIKDFLAYLEIKKFIKQEMPDEINLHSSKAGILGSIVAGRLKNKPKITYTVHGWVFTENLSKWKKNLYIFLERLASKYRDEIIVLTENEKQTALQFNICPPEKITIKPNRAHAITFMPKEKARKELNIPMNKKIFGTIANFYPSKGLEYFIQAMEKVEDKNKIAVIIGEGALREKYKKLIKELKLENRVLLLGHIDFASQYLSAFDVFIMSSIKEGAPYALLEATHYTLRLPIIATNLENIKELLKDYKNKILIPPANFDAITKAINDL